MGQDWDLAILSGSGTGVGVIPTGVGQDRIQFLTLVQDWDRTGFISTGAGQDRSGNPLPCQSLIGSGLVGLLLILKRCNDPVLLWFD